MAKKVVVNRIVVRAWDIDGYPNYFFGDDKQLYRYDSRGAIQQNKQVVVRYTTGYILKRKFFSLAKLRPMLKRHAPIDHPMDF